MAGCRRAVIGIVDTLHPAQPKDRTGELTRPGARIAVVLLGEVSIVVTC